MSCNRIAPVMLACLLVGACKSDPTEVVVVVTGDYDVPSEIDRVVVRAFAPDGTSQTAEATLDSESPFPRTVGLHNPDGALGPFRVEALGFLGNDLVVVRRAVFHFRENQSLSVDLPLLRDCADQVFLCNCTTTACSTCSTGGVCVNAQVIPRARSLAPSLDAGDGGVSLDRVAAP